MLRSGTHGLVACSLAHPRQIAQRLLVLRHRNVHIRHSGSRLKFAIFRRRQTKSQGHVCVCAGLQCAGSKAGGLPPSLVLSRAGPITSGNMALDRPAEMSPSDLQGSLHCRQRSSLIDLERVAGWMDGCGLPGGVIGEVIELAEASRTSRPLGPVSPFRCWRR